MGVALFTSGKPGGRIASGAASAFYYLVVLGVWVAFAVVETADDDWPVNVAFDEVDEHFLADARDGVAAPIGASDGG